MKYLIILVFIFCLNHLSAQLQTSWNITPTQMAQDLLFDYATSISNVSYTGSGAARGTFNGVNTTLGIDRGVILTTGTIVDNEEGPHGPNDDASAGIDNAELGFGPLTDLLGAQTYNATVLECDFVASSDTVKIEYVFGSDEYPEFVGTQFNDGFAFFISGPGINDTVNIASIPNTILPVSINNVNYGISHSGPCSFCGYYVVNGDGNDFPFVSDEQYIQYDGFTTPLTAFSLVQPGETYHLTIAIADIGDGIYDSGLFLKTNNLQSNLQSHDYSKQLKVYPNPNKGSFVVSHKEEQRVEDLQVIAADGKCVDFDLEKLNDLESRVNLKQSVPGMYWIKLITQNGEFYSSKFVIN